MRVNIRIWLTTAVYVAPTNVSFGLAPAVAATLHDNVLLSHFRVHVLAWGARGAVGGRSGATPQCTRAIACR